MVVSSQAVTVAARAHGGKSGWALSVIRGIDKLKLWVVGARSSHSPQGVKVSLIVVSRWSPSPSVVLGILGSS